MLEGAILLRGDIAQNTNDNATILIQYHYLEGAILLTYDIVQIVFATISIQYHYIEGAF